ncbi:hypothetical protein FHW96_000630 [Novosphingobium sp. SG751A]|nr:hypothetical protein [Novosphingobium sp. SG751A]
MNNKNSTWGVRPALWAVCALCNIARNTAQPVSEATRP